MNHLRSLLLTGLLLLCAGFTATACPTCKPAERTMLDDLTHGATPDSSAEYAIVGLFTVFLGATLFLTIRAFRKEASRELTH